MQDTIIQHQMLLVIFSTNAYLVLPIKGPMLKAMRGKNRKPKLWLLFSKIYILLGKMRKHIASLMIIKWQMRNSENKFQSYLEKNELQRAEVIKKYLLKNERMSLKTDGDERMGRKAFHGEMD